MKTLVRIVAPLLCVALVLAVAPRILRPDAAAAGTRYVCPPCGAACDTTTFNAPGICPACGMKLVEAGAARAQATQSPERKKVAILVFNGVEVLDFSGPYEMFGAANCDVFTVAATKEPVTSAMGLTVVPKYSFADAPPPDVLVIPGGGVYAASHDEATLRYIKDATAHASHTMSVCNGAFILANAGLLDGLTATTTYGNIPKLASQFPNIKVVRDRRYVDNGKIITAAGLSAGMDGALHVIDRLFGTGYAESVALSEEYDWKPSGGFARAALADHEIPNIRFDDVGQWDVVRTEGDTRHWDMVVSGRPKLPIAEVMSRVEQALTDGNWIKVGTAKTGSETRVSTWRFTGSDGRPWKATLQFDGGRDAGAKATAALTVDRAS